MAKIQIVGGRRIAVPEKKPTAKQVEKAHKLPVVRVKDTVSGLSLKQLLRATPPYIRSNSQEVIVKALRPATTKGGLPGIRAKVMSVQKKIRSLYDTTIVGKEKAIPVSQQKHVMVSCSCPDFCYTWEYALTHWGSSSIKYCNGDPAVVRNPQNQPGLCKHLYKLAAIVQTDGM